MALLNYQQVLDLSNHEPFRARVGAAVTRHALSVAADAGATAAEKNTAGMILNGVIGGWIVLFSQAVAARLETLVPSDADLDAAVDVVFPLISSTNVD